MYGPPRASSSAGHRFSSADTGGKAPGQASAVQFSPDIAKHSPDACPLNRKLHTALPPRPATSPAGHVSSTGVTQKAKVYPARVYRDCNVVAQDDIHRETVKKQTTDARLWDSRWGFFNEFDQKGVRREQKALPAEWAFFQKPAAPLTRQREIGHGLQSPLSKSIATLELSDQRRKRSTDLAKQYY